MRNQQLLKKIIYCFATLLTANSCLIETARAPTKQYVTIYTDCLVKNDLKLFSSFSKKEHIHVRIIHLPADSILSRLKKQKYNTNADILLLKSVFDINQLQREKLLQPVSSLKIDELIGANYKAQDNTWFGIGIDPYVFVSKNDSTSIISEFGELLKSSNIDKWSTNFKATNELVPLLAPFLFKKNNSAAKKWYYEFLANQHTQGVTKNRNGIPIMTTNVLLTSYSMFSKMVHKKDSINKNFDFHFSNQANSGAYYNLLCAGIIKQARNFENAKLLLEYISTAQMNEKLNNCWNTFPISGSSKKHTFNYQNTYFKIYKEKTSKIVVNYTSLANIIDNSYGKD